MISSPSGCVLGFKWIKRGKTEHRPDEFREFDRHICCEKSWVLLYSHGFGRSTIGSYKCNQKTKSFSSIGPSWKSDSPKNVHTAVSEISSKSVFSDLGDSDNDYLTQNFSTEGLQLSENGQEWSSDQLDAIASLFRGKWKQKASSNVKERPLPLAMPYKIRPLGLPKSKRAFRIVSPASFSNRSSLSKRLYKNPGFLINLAREIRSLPPEEDVSKVLDKWVGALRKGSLSLTIRELGRMGLPQRALQTFSWVQKCPQLVPDDRVLCSTLEILASTGDLKIPVGLQSSLVPGNQNELEAIARGFIKAGQLKQARQVLLAARDSCYEVDDGIYAKLIAAASKFKRGHNLASKLLQELGMRDKLKLTIQDCTAVMKACIKLGMHDVVESLFLWWKESGHRPNVVMYTTLMHSRYCRGTFREAFALVWEMEESNCLLDLPAYRVIIRVCAELGDLSRAVRFFSRMKNAGFSPTYDIYSHLIKLYSMFGRLVKCKEIWKEMETVGFRPNPELVQYLSENLSENDSSL